MASEQTMWVDAERCTGCGACIDQCPTGAIALADGKARVDEDLCEGCEACVDACPQDAIHPVLQGEIVTAPERPAPAVQRSRPLVETAGAAVAAASAGLLARAGGALIRAVERWLTQRPASAETSIRRRQDAEVSERPPVSRSTGRGRRARHRRRGQ